MPHSESRVDRFRLNVHANDDCTRIEVLDGNLRSLPLQQNLGEISLDLPAGVYVVRFYQGPGFTEKLAALAPTTPTMDVSLSTTEEPLFAAAAPIASTGTSHEWQSEPAQQLSLSPARPLISEQPNDSNLLIFLRNPFTGLKRSQPRLPL